MKTLIGGWMVDRMKTLDVLEIGETKIVFFTKEGNENILYRFSLNDKQRVQYSSKTDSLRIAKERALERIDRIKKNKIHSWRRYTFIEVADMYIKSLDARLKSRTIKDYKQALKYPKQHFNKAEIQHCFSNTLIKKYIAWRIKKYGLRPYAINNEVMLIKLVAKYAIGNIEELQDYKTPTIKQRQYPEKRRERILTEDEYNRMLNHLKDTNNMYFYNVVSFLSNSGVRIGEMIRLKYRDIKENIIVIQAGKTKTRSIPYTTILREIISYLNSRWIDIKPDDYVFLNDKKHHQENYWQCFSKALKRIGITERIPIYTLRAYYTTQMLMKQVCNIPMLAAVLGNSPITLHKHYSHLESHSAAMAILVKVEV